MSRTLLVASASVPLGNNPMAGSTYHIDAALSLARQAGEAGADLLVLPESCGSAWCEPFGKSEPLDGPTLAVFAEVARTSRMYVVLPLLEKLDSDRAAITAVLLDRNGRMVGKYRKTHLAPSEAMDERIVAGDELPVFQTDFGCMGIAICMDIHVPELFTCLALKGAELIAWPTMALDYTGDLIESLVNARAIDNQMYMVPSHYVQMPYLAGKQYGRSRIVDCMGRTRASTGHFPGLALARIDLEQTYPMWYDSQTLEKYPTMRRIYQQLRRPELYDALTHMRGNQST